MSILKNVILLLSLAMLSACGDNDSLPTTQAGDVSLDVAFPPGSDAGTSNFDTEIAIADGFCVNQKKLQIVSTSLLSAYSPKGNGSDLNYCGGENSLIETGGDFSLKLTDYCVDARGVQVKLNGDISGTTESGANFISSIINNLNIAGKDLNLDITGNSWDGRADDNFVNLQITDNSNSKQLLLEEVSIKKGEFDFGYIALPDLGRVPFKFITHFNDDNTEGLLFIYGEADERIIISGDNGMITAVYTKDRHDDGTWLDLPCNN